jgi:cytochrome oxidase Cu insertion factor (SCO1/SenC/PrrC family)
MRVERLSRGIFCFLTLVGILFSSGKCSLVAQGLRLGIIPDTPVVDQDGNARYFFTDLIKGRVVAINFGYTSCTSVCPMQGQRFSQLQNLLGTRLGKDIFLVTVTTDPTNDTPTKLKAWGAQFGAKPGWTLVTGNPTDIQQLLSTFISVSSSPTRSIAGQEGARHLPVVVMLNEPLGLSKVDFSLSSAFWVNRSLTKWWNLPVPLPTTKAKR